MNTYLWQVTLLATVRVSSPTKAASQQRLQEIAIELSARIVERAPVITGFEIEGDADLIDVIEEEGAMARA